MTVLSEECWRRHQRAYVGRLQRWTLPQRERAECEHEQRALAEWTAPLRTALMQVCALVLAARPIHQPPASSLATH
jgi:hypothetical protein